VSTGAALAVVLVVLVAVNLWVHLGPPRVHVLTGPLAALALLLVARAAGLSWSELGLAREDLLSGAAYGAVTAGAVAVVYLVAVAVPFTRGAFRDTRYQVGPGAAVLMALVTVPLATVVFEEVAFRSVLWGLLESEGGAAQAVVVTAALFGLWHVLPALKLARTNQAIRGDGGPPGSRALLTVLATVAFTTAAGILFAELRRRSGSLLAPVILHWATNGLGVLAAARVWALSSRPPS
jgi:membrane protease YdiL (CAAX protease family)